MEPSKQKYLLNQSAVKAFALRVSESHRAGKFRRVGQTFIDACEADMENGIRQLSGTQPDGCFDGGLKFVTGHAVDRARERLDQLATRIIFRKVMRHPTVGCTLLG